MPGGDWPPSQRYDVLPVRDLSHKAATIVSCQLLFHATSSWTEVTLADTRLADCPECSEDKQDVDMCQDCYRQGRTCRSPDTHRLYVYLRANSDGPHPDIATDGIGCKACKAKIKQGPFYCEYQSVVSEIATMLIGN